MEMTLTVHLPRRRPRPVDVRVRWSGGHTADDLCAALAEHLGEPVGRLSARGRDIPSDAVLGLPPLVHGAAVTVGPGSAEVVPSGLLHLAVVGGPDAGRSHALTPPALVVGRAPASGLVLRDEALSRDHAVFRVDASGVVVEDLGSTNGVVVDGDLIDRPTAVDSGSVVVVGASTLRLRRPPPHGLAALAGGDGHEAVPTAPPRSAPEEVVEIACPAAPPEHRRTRVPWVAAMVPVPIGIALAVFLGPQLLVFALLGPVMLLASALGDRWGALRATRRDAAAHEVAVRRAHEQLTAALADERSRLDRVHPDPQAVLTTVERRMPGLWAGDHRLGVRLGIGEATTRVALCEDGSRTHPAAPRTAVTVSLVEVECLGIVGPDEVTTAVLRSVVGQLCAAHPPTRLVVAFTSSSAEWSWSRWLPHRVDLRTVTDGVAGGGGPRGSPHPARVLVVPPRGTGPPGDVVSAARTAGWLVVVAARDRVSLPDGCGSVLDARSGHPARLESPSSPTVSLVPDLVGVWWAERVARALAPLRCAGATPGPGSGSGAVPDAVGLDEVLGSAGAAPQTLNEGWADAVARGGGLAAPAAVVGRGPHGIHAIDLSRDGPHVLVGGTTGSGKSEFLRTLIVSLSLSSPPSDLTLVLVDFKGGAAFGPCADLPHVVGLVTDLDDHLAARALTSLRAELRRRERMLADAGAPDLEAYARSPRANAEPMPRLVVVIDELRTLVDEVPEFVSGLVRLAAQGRSLGIHLVLATQRPAGAITAEVQANVSLRIAFRVRDRTDSVTVVEDGAAADLPATAPGRAVARGADGRLLTFQSAILGPARPHARARFLEVTRVRTVADVAAGPATQPTSPAPRRRSAGWDWTDGGAATEAAPALQRLRVDATREIVRRVIEAHRLTGAAAPRRPWLPPLPTHLTPATLANVPTLGVPDPPGGAVPTTASTAVAADGGVPVGLVDEPDAQRVSALRWHPEGGTWLLSGAPRSGRTRAVRCLVLQAVSAADPRALHVHLVDPTGTLVDLVGLPHVGTRADGNDVRALTSLVDHLRSEVDRRRALHGVGRPPQGPEPTVLVVVDGWEQLAERLPGSAWGSPLDDLLRVLRDGASVGIVGAVAGGRGLLQPRWAGIGGSTFLLGRLDPLDLALAGLRAAEAPKNPAVGRGIRLADRREVQFASADDVLLAGVVRRAGPRPADGAAWRYHPLPQRILLPSPEGSVAHPVVGHVLGISAGDHEVVAWEPERQGRVLLVSGPPRSGRTNVLRVLAASITADGRRLAMVSRAPLGPLAGHGVPIKVVHPEDVDVLVDARRRDPALAVLVDDADLLDEAPIGPPLKEILELVDRDDGLFVAVASATGLGSRFRGIDVAVARRRTGLLLAPSPADGDLLGAPATHGIPALPGRGLLVSGGTPTELQVYLAPESGVGPAPADGAVGAVGLDARDAVVGGRYEQRGRGRGDRDAEDAPSDEGLVAPDQPDPHRDQERAPHDRRGPGPRGVAEPPPGQGREADAPHEDEQRRHDDPRRVAPLTDGELVDVEHGEAHEDGGLQTGQRGGEPAGAA